MAKQKNDDWISVKDRLPEPVNIFNGKRYLIRITQYVYAVSLYMKGFKSKYNEELKSDGFRTMNGDGTYNHYENVTHWKEIEEPLN